MLKITVKIFFYDPRNPLFFIEKYQTVNNSNFFEQKGGHYGYW